MEVEDVCSAFVVPESLSIIRGALGWNEIEKAPGITRNPGEFPHISPDPCSFLFHQSSAGA